MAANSSRTGKGAQDPALAALLASDLTLGEQSVAERTRLTYLHQNWFRVYEDAFYQYRTGNLDPELWVGWQGSIRLFFSDSRNAVEIWNSRRGLFHTDFRESIDGILADLE